MADPSFDINQKMSITLPRVNLRSPKKDTRAKVLDKLEKGKVAGANALTAEIRRRLEQSIRSSTWSWPRTTLRRNGTTAGYSRDIVDTGMLLSSQKTALKISQNKFIVEMTNTAPYATLVHYGGVVQPYGNKNANSVLIPGRPWVTAIFEGTNGQEKIDVFSFMSRYFKV